MNEERNGETIGDLHTWGPDGPLPEEEPMGGTGGWDPSQTIGGGIRWRCRGSPQGAA